MLGRAWEIIEQIPSELRGPIVELVEQEVRSEVARRGIVREDFEELKGSVQRLAEAQARTEAAVEKLAQAQARTEEQLDRLEAAVEKLSQAQARTEERLDRFERTFGGYAVFWSEGGFLREDGPSTTSVTEGAVFPIVTGSEGTNAPKSSPSLGSTVQDHACPFAVPSGDTLLLSSYPDSCTPSRYHRILVPNSASPSPSVYV